MREFKARDTGAISGVLYSRQDAFSSVVPGIPLRLHNDGTWDPPSLYWDNPGTSTITYGNLHRMYVCQSWRDSINRLGNEMAAMIPITQQFSALMIVTLSDFLTVTDIRAITPGTRFAFVTGKLAEPTIDSPPIFQVIRKPIALFNGEYEIEVATWGLRLSPESGEASTTEASTTEASTTEASTTEASATSP